MEKTFCTRPMHLSDFRNVPGPDYANETVPAGRRLPGFDRFVNLMMRLAPDPGTAIRSLWIEAVRGEPEEWALPEPLLADGLISDREEYEDLWRAECPYPVEWFRITLLFLPRGPVLYLTDGERFSCPVEGDRIFLGRLSEYVERLLRKEGRNKGAYSRYMEANFPYRKRRGTVSRSAWNRIFPEWRPAVTESQRKLLERLCDVDPAAVEGYEKMTERSFIKVRDRLRSRIGTTGTEECPDARHCIVPSEIHLVPFRREDGRWYFSLQARTEYGLEMVLELAETLEGMDVPFVLKDADAILDIVSGKDRITIFPGSAGGTLREPETVLPPADDPESERRLAELIAAAEWEPVPVLRIDKNAYLCA